jgi:hypothetical protein
VLVAHFVGDKEDGDWTGEDSMSNQPEKEGADEGTGSGDGSITKDVAKATVSGIGIIQTLMASVVDERVELRTAVNNSTKLFVGAFFFCLPRSSFVSAR